MESLGMKLRIIKQHDGGNSDPTVLGMFEVHGMTLPEAELYLGTMWLDFQRAKPDTDSKFISYVCARDKRFKNIENDFHDIVF